MAPHNSQYYKNYYLNNKEKMIASAKASYQRQKHELAFCAACEKSVKKLGYNQHCLSKKHIKNLEKITEASTPCNDDLADLKVEEVEEVEDEDEEEVEEVVEDEEVEEVEEDEDEIEILEEQIERDNKKIPELKISVTITIQRMP